MKNIRIILVVFLAGGCKHNIGVESVVMDVAVHLYIVDANGNNLLDDHRFTDGLKLFYLVDGKEIEVFNQFLDAKRNYKIIKRDVPGRNNGVHVLRVAANTYGAAERTVTLLRWDNATTDTLTTSLWRKRGSIGVMDIWFNSELVWTLEMGKKKYESGEVTDLSNLITIVR